MEYVYLGRTGLKVSRLCLGTMNFGPETNEKDSFAIMDKAIDLGINFFDTANVYGWKIELRKMKELRKISSVAGLPGVKDVAKKSYWQRKYLAKWANGPMNNIYQPFISNEPVKKASNACRPIISTCTRCIISIEIRPGRRSGRQWNNWFEKGK